LVEIAEKYSRGQIASFNLLGSSNPMIGNYNEGRLNTIQRVDILVT